MWNPFSVFKTWLSRNQQQESAVDASEPFIPIENRTLSNILASGYAGTGGEAARTQHDLCPNCGSVNYFTRKDAVPQCYDCNYSARYGARQEAR